MKPTKRDKTYLQSFGKVKNYTLLWVVLVIVTVSTFGTLGYAYGYGKAKNTHANNQAVGYENSTE